MRARDRLSKLLLRHGIVYYGGAAWTGAQDRWLSSPPSLAGCRACGVSTLTGFALAVEIGDWSRFTGNTIASFGGLVPSEHSSGSSRVQGSNTKTGNTHVRRLLVEAAWHHRPRYHVGAVMRSRWEKATAAARARGDGPGNWLGAVGRRVPLSVGGVAVLGDRGG